MSLEARAISLHRGGRRILGDVSLREPCKLRNFKRRERKYLLAMLERTKNLDEDISRRRRETTTTGCSGPSALPFL